MNVQTGGRGRAKARSAEAKSIVLFSDGTGNSSAKLFKTNVWRMYEAVDLGPAPPGKRNQIAYYDDGVGTSGFRPLAVMGGVFGWGLKRNVLDIYQYACRNYDAGPGQEPGANPDRLGDHIYGFGFSRGAFTMRTAISLIASQGLVRYTDERDLERRSQDAYRAFCATGSPRYLKWLVRGYRAARGRLSVGWRRLRGIPLYDPDENHRPVIRFIGVWDTVAAYGGPIAEITRAIDNWFFAMSMPNYKLNLEIERARHALALDDERDSFHPLLWDEVHEQALIERREAGDETVPAWVDEDRLHQVWFTGMHADVGGGYPDESLSYVSLLWMIEEAGKADLRTLEVIGSRYRALANSYGPIHDSRSGLGSYYRYQPRKIDTWLDPVRPATLGQRDPAITDDEGRPRGLVPEGRIRIHESVVARIQDGTDSYAPIVLPENFQIVRPAARGENQPQADSETSGRLCVLRSEYRVLPMVEPEVRARFTDQELASGRSAAMERLWNLVMARRATYFLTVLATLAMVSMPLWIEGVPEPLELTNNRTFGWETLFLNDGRNWIGSLVRLLGLFVPAFLESWIETYSTNPFYFLLVSATIVILLVSSKSLERRLRDRARAAWLPTTGRASEGRQSRRPSLLQKLRTAPLYQRTVQIMKWHVLPNVIFMPILLLLAGWIGLAVATQVTLPSLERSDVLCGGAGSAGPQIQMRQSILLPGRPCNPAGGMVQQGKSYALGIEVREPWFDGTLPATPLGLAAGAVPNGAGYLGVPLRRVIDARYLQPLIAIRSTSGGRQRLHIYPLDLEPTGGPDGGPPSVEDVSFHGEFVAPATGELFLFVNDAMLPFGKRGPFGFDSTYFYRGAKVGNRGSACVSIGVAGDLDPNFEPETVDRCASLPPAPQREP